MKRFTCLRIQVGHAASEEPVLRPALTLSRSRRFYLALLVIILIIASLATFFALSYNSAHGTIVQIVSASRRLNQGPSSAPFETLTFVVEVHVWSWGATLETHIHNPTFNLSVDNFALPIPDYGVSASFQPGSYAPYQLAFATADHTMIHAEGQAGSNNLKISMNVLVTSGLYSEQRTVSDSRDMNW